MRMLKFQSNAEFVQIGLFGVGSSILQQGVHRFSQKLQYILFIIDCLNKTIIPRQFIKSKNLTFFSIFEQTLKLNYGT